MEPLEVARPFMPGYGTLAPDEGTGLLPWLWAAERLSGSHDYWLATVTPSGRPHLMPVWAVFMDDRLWFSSSNGSRKARNLEADPRCSLATQDPRQMVVVEGRAERISDPKELETMLAAENAKYGTDYGLDMLDPAHNTCWALRPERVFGLDSSDFTGSPTRWTF